MITRYSATTTKVSANQRLTVLDLDLLQTIVATHSTGQQAENEIAARLGPHRPRMTMALLVVTVADEAGNYYDDEAVDLLEQLASRMEECQGNGAPTRLVRSFTADAKALLARAKAPQAADTAA